MLRIESITNVNQTVFNFKTYYFHLHKISLRVIFIFCDGMCNYALVKKFIRMPCAILKNLLQTSKFSTDQSSAVESQLYLIITCEYLVVHSVTYKFRSEYVKNYRVQNRITLFLSIALQKLMSNKRNFVSESNTLSHISPDTFMTPDKSSSSSCLQDLIMGSKWWSLMPRHPLNINLKFRTEKGKVPSNLKRK